MKIALIGPIRAGKSTYIAALWHLLYRRALGLGVEFLEHPADRDQLLKLESSWLTCDEVVRTADSGAFDFSLGTVAIEGGAAAELVVPDRAGESYREQWVNRQLDEQYVSTIVEAVGVLAFIHPGYLVKPRRIDALTDEVAKLAGETEATAPIDVEQYKDKEWDRSKAPTEVILIELLQFIHAIRVREAIPISLIISAWDTVERDKRTPFEWLREECPLLSQFLEVTRRGGADITIYGVSATGGDLEREKERLRDIADPTKRPYIVSSDGVRSHNLAAPIVHLLRASSLRHVSENGS